MYRLLKLRNLAPALLLLVGFYFFLSFSVEASALPSPATGVMAQPTVPTPPPVIELAIAANAGKVQLDWTDDFAEEEYEVHRSTAPFFGLDASTLLTTVPAGTQTYLDTSSGLGNTSLNYFYKIKATGGNLVADSNFVGEIDYPLKNTSGAYSLIGIPFVNPSPSDAAGLAAQIGSVSNIYHWDTTGTPAFRIFTPPDIDNFPLTYGDAIFVQVGGGAPSSVSVMGKVWPNVLTLRPDNYNFMTMPFLCDELTNASTTAADITGVANLLQWNMAFQNFLTFTPPDVGDDFALKVGAPFVAQLGPTGSQSWPSYLTSACK